MPLITCLVKQTVLHYPAQPLIHTTQVCQPCGTYYLELPVDVAGGVQALKPLEDEDEEAHTLLPVYEFWQIIQKFEFYYFFHNQEKAAYTIYNIYY